MKKTKKLLVRFTMIMIIMMTIIMISVMVMMMVSVMAIDGDINYRMKAANPGWDETACPGAV